MATPALVRAGASKILSGLTQKGLLAVQEIGCMSDYEHLVYSKPNILIISLFTAKFSLWSKLLNSRFADLALQHRQSESLRFIHVDVDQVPRAAYHAEVEAVPTVVLMRGDDAYRKRLAPPNHCEFDRILPALEKELDEYLAKKDSPTFLNSLRSRYAWYDHNIRKDNLNVYRVGWEIET